MRALLLIAILIVAPTFAFASRSFSGSGQYLSNASALVGNSYPFSISIWFRTTTLATDQVLYGINKSDSSGFYIYFQGTVAGDPLLAGANNNGVSAGNASTGTSGISTGVWYHAGATFVSTTSRSIFFNGSKFTNTTSVVPTSLTTTVIGAFNPPSNAVYFSGELGECGVWNVTLTDDEMVSLSKGVSPLRVRPSALVDYWWLVGNTTGENGIKGNVLTNTSSTHNADHPRIYR